MDRFGIEKATRSVSATTRPRAGAQDAIPDRFVPSGAIVDPNDVMGSVRAIRREYEEYGIRATVGVPVPARFPQVPIDDPKMYPIYATCVELGIPIFVCAGVPGPRVPLAPQQVELIDDVMFDFPDLVFVTRHGCEPWEDLAVKLMLKWPNLYYSTSAFAPKYYPKAIIDYANTRGADKVIYAGYFPMGLSLERIFTDMPKVPLQGRGVAEVPVRQRRTGSGSGGLTPHALAITGAAATGRRRRPIRGAPRAGRQDPRRLRCHRFRRIAFLVAGIRRQRLPRSAPAGAGRRPGRHAAGYGLRDRGRGRGVVARTVAVHGDGSAVALSAEADDSAGGALMPTWRRARRRSWCCPTTPISVPSPTRRAGGSTARPVSTLGICAAQWCSCLRAPMTAANCGSWWTRPRGAWRCCDAGHGPLH